MKTKILLRARWLLCTMLAVFLTASAWAETVTYTVSTATAVTATGTAPDGSSATLAGSGTLNSGFIQCTASQNKTLTLSGFNGYKITAITISVKSNSKKGSGSFSVTAGSTTLAEITTAAFNDGSWNGTYSTSAVDKVLTMSDDDYEIQENEDVTFTLAATVNSLYIQSWTITYESVSGGGETKTLSAVDIEGISTMTKKTYETTDHLDLSELTVKGTYSDNSEQTFTSGITWKVKATSASLDEFTPETFTLTTDMTSVWVQATVNSVSSPWTEISGLTVSEHTVTPGTYSIVPNNNLWGTNYNGTASGISYVTGSQDDITITLSKGSSSNNMYINTVQSRAYNGYTMQFSVPTGYVIKAIAFTADGSNWAGTHTADVGTMTDDKNWEGANQTVTITFAGTCRIAGISVEFEAAGACSAPSITTQPVGATYMQNDAATALTVAAEACENISGELSYQWYSNTTESNEGGIAISGANSASYTPATTEAGVVYYYCVIMQGLNGTATSNAVAVSVEGPEVGVSFEQEASAYTDWTFNEILSQQTGSITAHTKTYYGTTNAKASASMVTANKIAGPDALGFFVSKQSTNTTASTWYVRVSSDGTTWTEVTSESATSMSKGEWIAVNADLSSYTNVYVGIFYEGSTAVRNIDDVILTTRDLVASVITYNDSPDHGLLSIKKDNIELASNTTLNEGDVMDVILAADDGYIGTVTVTKTVGGNDVTEDVYNAETGKLTMPAYDITITATFAIGVEAPVFDVADGTYTTSQLVLLSTATTGASIYYTMTTDGSTPANPTSASTLYDANEGISLDARGTYNIKAIAYKDENHSTVASATYTINPPFATVTELITYVTTNNLTALSDVTVTGVVSKIQTAYNSQYGNVTIFISDDGQTEQLEGYRTKDGDGITAASVVAVGDKVTLKGNYKFYNSTTHELEQNNTIEAYTAKVLSSVVVSGTPDQTEYSAGDQFQTTGLVVTANYSNTGYSKVVTDDVTWNNTLTNNEVTVTEEVLVTATYDGMESDPYAVNVTVSSKALTEITLSQSAYTIYKEQTYTKPTVTAHFDDNSTEDVTAIATDDAATAFDNTVVGLNTVTISYTYGGATQTAQYTVNVQAYANADNAPYTVTEALAIIEGFSSNSADEIVVAGTVSEEKMGNTNGRYKISDGTNELTVWNGKGFNSANFTNTNYPQIGDEVIVKGKVVNYNGVTPEFATNLSYLLSQIRPVTLAVEDVTAFEVGAADMAESDLTINRDGSDGAITFTTGNESLVTIIDGKLHAVAEGIATITANMAATANEDALNYSAATTTFNVTVVGVQPRYTVTFSANGGAGTAPVVEDQLEGATFTLPANTFTYAGHKFTGWNDGTTDYAVGATYTMPAANVTFTAQWETVCPWATVYTSNVVFEGAEDNNLSSEPASFVKIADVDYDAQKVGSSSKDGAVVVTVPAGAHTLHFHAASWNSADITISVEAEGVTNMNPTSFEVKKDAGVKNSGTYTLANDPVDQHFHFTFDALAAETQFTFSKTSGSDKRFVMYGINQEGGPELKSLTIGGTATTTAYEVGQSFSTAGLTVNAVYTVDGVDQEPEDVTGRVVWSIDPAEFTLTSQTSVTVTASLETKTTSTTIPVTVSETSTPGVTHTAIVVKKGDTWYAMGQNLSSGALNAVELEGVINGKMVNVPVEDRAAITWEVTITPDGATYKAQNGKYLKGNSSNTTLSWSDEPFYWTWSDTYGCYAVENARSFYMYGNNTSDFKNYALVNFSNNASNCSSGTMELSDYVDVDLTDKEFVTLREGLEAGKLGTICWEYDIYEVEGATFYEPEVKLEDGVRFIESLKEGGVYPKGKPYLFQAEGEVIRALVSKTDPADVAGTNNGMFGTFVDLLANPSPDTLIIYQNKLRPSSNNWVRAHRAYLLRSQLPGTANPAPNRRRLVMGRYDSPTAIESIERNAEGISKVLIDGQIYIVRDGKWYDVTGRQVR